MATHATITTTTTTTHHAHTLTPSHTVTPTNTSSCRHTTSHTHTNSHTLTHAHTPSHTLLHVRIHSHTYTPSHILAHTLTHPRTQTQLPAHAYPPPTLRGGKLTRNHKLSLSHTQTHAHARITHPASGPCVAYAVVLEGLCEADASGGAAEAYAVCALCRVLSVNNFSGDVKPLANMTGLTFLYYTRYV